MKVEKFTTSGVRGISIDYNECNYLVIYGKYINGGFYSIPNWGIGGELSNFLDDVFWNAESIGRVLKDKKAANVIAKCIAEDSKIEHL